MVERNKQEQQKENKKERQRGRNKERKTCEWKKRRKKRKLGNGRKEVAVGRR